MNNFPINSTTAGELADATVFHKRIIVLKYLRTHSNCGNSNSCILDIQGHQGHSK